MSTTGTVVIVAGVGAAVFLYLRSQQQSQAALSSAAAGAAAAGSGGGGGITGFAQGLFNQWKGDPLGIKNTKAAVSGVVGVGKTAVSQVGGAIGGAASAGYNFVKGLF